MSAPSMHTPPPPQPGFEPAPAPPSRALGYAVIAAAAVVAGINVLAWPLAGPAAERFEEALRAGGTTLDVYTAYDLVTTFVLPAQLVALVLTGLWLLRLRRFGERLQPQLQHARRRWWAFGGWVVPIVSLWFPYQYVRDVQTSLHPVGWRHTRLVGRWWMAFLAMAILDRVTSRISVSQNPDVAAQLPMFAAALAVANVVALVLWVVLVRDLLRTVDEVPTDVLDRTALAPDPGAYAHDRVPPGAPLYGPGPLNPSTPASPPGQQPPDAGPTGGPAGGPGAGRPGPG